MYNSVPADNNTMNEIKQSIHNGLQSEGIGDFLATAEDVSRAITLLKNKKTDGDKDLW